jgi:hypothetical protein
MLDKIAADTRLTRQSNNSVSGDFGRSAHRIGSADSNRETTQQKKGNAVVALLVQIQVRVRGFEPPPTCVDMALNHARLPVPPHPQLVLGSC